MELLLNHGARSLLDRLVLFKFVVDEEENPKDWKVAQRWW